MCWHFTIFVQTWTWWCNKSLRESHFGIKSFQTIFNPTNIGNDEGDDDDDDDVLHEQSLSAPTTFGGPGRLRITSFASWDLATMAWKIYLDIYPKPWPIEIHHDFGLTKIYPKYNDSIKRYLFLWWHLIFHDYCASSISWRTYIVAHLI